MASTQIIRQEAEKRIRTEVNLVRTICEVWREIWDLSEQIQDEKLKEEIRDKIIDGFIMGKKMDGRLRFYKKEWSNDIYTENSDVELDREIREKREKNIMASKNFENLFSIQIELTDWCNRKCRWCPNHYLDKKEPHFMQDETLDIVLSKLKEVNWTGRIHPYLNGEPLSDPQFLTKLRKIREVFPTNHLMISTNGDFAYGAHELEKLVDAGLNEIQVSHYDFQNSDLAKKKIPGVHHFTMSDLRQTFYNRGGKVKIASIDARPKCEWLFSKLYVNYRGEVILCCSDFSYEVILGDLKTQSLFEIWNSEKYASYRKAHDAGLGHTMPLCNACDRIIQKRRTENV